MKQLKLCLVTNIGNKPFHEYLQFIEQAVAGGVTMVQLREKFIPYSEIKKEHWHYRIFCALLTYLLLLMIM